MEVKLQHMQNQSLQAAGLPVMHSLHILDALELIFTPFKSALCVELTLQIW